MTKDDLDYRQDGDPRGFVDSPQIQHQSAAQRTAAANRFIADTIVAIPPLHLPAKRDPSMDEWSLETELDDYLREYGEQALLNKIKQFMQTRGLV